MKLEGIVTVKSTFALIVYFSLTFLSFSAAGQTVLYSRKTPANWNDVTAGNGTWSTTSGGASCNCYPGDATHVGWSAVIASGHTITLTSANYTLNSISALTVNGILNFGSGATARILTVGGDVTINTGATLRSGNTGATAHTIQIAGNLVNNGTFNQTINSPTNQTTVFNGTVAQNITGSGSYTFYNLTINGTAGNSVNVNRSILINGGANALTFSSDRLLVVNSTSNITLGGTATVSGAGNLRYIQLDGDTGADSQLIKTSAGTTASWRINYPIGTSSGGYTPLNLPTVGGTAPTTGATLSIKVIYNASVQGQLRRTFRMVIGGNAVATTFANPRFNFVSASDVSSGDAIGNYSSIWYLSAGNGTWGTTVGAIAAGSFTVTTPSHNLISGTYYYTIGSSTAYPNTWYSYQTGEWSSWQNWTLDPSGTTLVNGLNLPPQPGDEVVILNGLTITNDVSGQVVSNTTIEEGGTLDMAATTGNTLGTVSGTGLLRMQGINLPTGIYTSFVALGTGGTVEYYNTGGTLPAGQTTYNKLLLSNTTGSDIIFITTNNLTVNSDFNITQTSGGGTVTWQINDATAATRTLTLNGNLTISANSQIRAGTGNSGTPHALAIYGNITNNGSIRFFDNTGGSPLTDANYLSGAVYTTALRGDAVNVTFKGTSSQALILNNQTDFYRFILDKGTGQQAMLTVNSSSTSNFRLFGPNNQARSGTAPNVISNNNLSIVNGTLQLIGSIDIPSLITDIGSSNSWAIPQNGALWLNSSNVTIQVASNTASGDNKHFQLYGLLRISNGTLNLGYSRGLLGGGSGSLVMEGGTINTWQLRTTNTGTNNNFAYYQSGGIVNVGTQGLNGINIDDYPRFALNYATCTFQMTGGTLNVGNPMPSGIGIGGGIQIASSGSSYTVTGGTVNIYIPASAVNFTITSTAPFYDLNIYKDGAGTAVAILNSISASDGTATVEEAAQPLIILNDLTLKTTNSPALNCNGQNLTIAGNFDIQTGAALTPDANMITFNGTGAQGWTLNGTVANLSSVVVNKSAGVLTLSGTGTLPDITTGLTLISGTMNDGGKTITVTGALSNSATHTSTGSGVIVLNGATIISGADGTFGNLTIQTNNTVATSGNQKVTGTLRLLGANTTLNIGSYNLAALGSIYSDGNAGVAFTAAKRIRTAGFRNDGGLTRQSVNLTDILFPVGTGALYTPITTYINATVHGKITVSPVAGQHPNVNPTAQSIQYYWVVTSTEFNGVTTAVTHKTYTFNNTAFLQGTLTSYKPARYNQSTFTWSIGTTYSATGTTVIPDFSFGTNIDGEYTAGNLTAGAILAYYSRVNGNWNTAATWSNDAARSSTSVSVPCPTCPVVIGDGVSFNHTININVNNITCGSLQIAAGSTLDCNIYTGLNFGVNIGEVVTGTGTLRVNISSGQFPAGDFKDFIGSSGGTVEWYGANTTGYTIPTTGSAPQNLNLNTYYNLIVNPTTGQTITLPANNLTIYNTVTKNGAGTVNTSTGVRTLTINGDLVVNQGSFTIVSGAGNTSSFVISGNTTVASGAMLQAQNAASTHSFTTSGNITNNGTINFRNTNGLVNLIFTGATNTSFSGPSATATTLNTITINKGTSQVPILMVDVYGTTINTPTNAWLTLVNGTINFNNSGTYTLSTSITTPYSIPSTARLKVQAGTVNIIGNVNDNDGDLLLAGTLEVAGGNLNINPIANNRNINNDIEYASAGTPTIIVSGGALYVNGAIRRSMSTLSGALVYNQSAGTVTIGGRNCDANNTRGVFEIESNAGSNFTMSGGTLIVQRSTLGSSFADLYINPVSSSVSSASTIQFGMSTNTAVTTPMSINIVPAVGNLSILGNAGTAQVMDMRSSELTTSGTLTINTNSTLETNGLDVYIGGDLSITGTYNGTISGGNTTTFNGSALQNGTLTSGSTFQNITIDKTSGSVAALSGNSTINNLNILNGELSISGTLDITGDVVNNSIQSGSGIINFAGTSTAHSITSTGGSFTNLNLGGTAATKRVIVSGDLTITGTLDFTTSGTSRYLYIGSNKLTFSQTALNPANVGGSRFIRTNGISSDFGIVKDWPAGTRSFIYAIGTRTNYTPATFTNLKVNTAGTFTVIAVDDQHPTTNALGEQILNYYWIGIRGSTLAYDTTGTVTHTYQFPAGFVGGAGGTLIAAHLDAVNLKGWTPSPDNGGSVNTPANTIMTFTAASLRSNLPGTGTSGREFHYTAGTTNTLPNPVTPVYSRLENNSATVGDLSTGGSWTLATNWTTSSTGYGGTVQSVVPVGRPVEILPGARINMDVVGLRAFSSKINGLLVVDNTAGHSLGAINGTGTLRSSNSTLPAGDYTNFVSSSGGTIEYAAIADMNMNNRSAYNNLSILGPNVVTITAADLALEGDLTIASGARLNNAVNNRNISIKGDWVNNGGTFTPGTGTVIFSGSAGQTVTGTTTFNDVTVAKSGNVVLSGTATTVVNDVLTLTTGHIIASSAHPLVMGALATVSGGGSSSFVQGPVRRNIGSGGTFTYPLGSTVNNQYRPATVLNTSGADTWTAEYIGEDPTTGGYSYQNFNSANLGKVSMFEYWNVSRLASTAADLSLPYNVGSYIAPDIGNTANLRVARWNGTQWDLPPGAASFSQSGSNITGKVTVTNVTSFSPFTFGSLDNFSPLPVTLKYFQATLTDDEVDLTWETAQEINNDYFTVEKSTDLERFLAVSVIDGRGTTPEAHTYRSSDASPYFGRSYYRLKQMDFDGNPSYSGIQVINYEGPRFASLRIYPNPVKGQILTVEFVGLKDVLFVPVQLINLQGQTLMDKMFEVKTPGTLRAELNIGNSLVPGLYIIKAGSTLQLIKKIVIE